MHININITQGIHDLPYADVNIIVDVIRAFTVSYYAFKSGVKEIILAKDESEAFQQKKNIPSSIISGEKNGYQIKGFDFGNSPYDISLSDLQKKILIQKTTNGVKATLNSLNAKNVFVTGFINSQTLISYIKKIIKISQQDSYNINIIASHPKGDDDLACAQYLKEHILNNVANPKELDKETLYRILHSDAAEKFFNKDNKDFYINDIVMVLDIETSNFVIEVIQEENKIKLKKRIVKCMD